MVATTEYERKLRKKGYRVIAGVDEVGRGAWAGPVVAGAVVLSPERSVAGIRDSKDLIPRKRAALFPLILDAADSWAVGVVSAATIDAIGIAEANRRAMRIALAHLRTPPDYVLIDAMRLSLSVPCEGVVDGDGRVRSIAAASIVAKVWRDHLMTMLDRTVPSYAFGSHKGYGTCAHEEAIRAHGMSAQHRRTFVPKSRIRRQK